MKEGQHIIVRQATISDLQQIIQLNMMLFHHHGALDPSLVQTWSFSKDGVNQFKDRLSQGLAAIALDGEKAVGYIIGAPKRVPSFRKLSSLVELESIFVLDEYRDFGIGTRLVDIFIKLCKSQGIEKIKVEVAIENPRAISFYEGNGFKEYVLLLECNV